MNASQPEPSDYGLMVDRMADDVTATEPPKAQPGGHIEVVAMDMLDDPAMRIIGLCGPARAGKDTVAQIIGQLGMERSLFVKRQGFADKLKLSFARIFEPDCDLPRALAFCNQLKVDHNVTITPDITDESGLGQVPRVTGREALQHYGTEAHRQVFGEDFWLDAVLPVGRQDCDILVIPDVRFQNEADRVRSRGGQIWHVERPDVEEIEAHASETGIDLVHGDTVIMNDGTIEQLHEKVDAEL